MAASMPAPACCAPARRCACACGADACRRDHAAVTCVGAARFVRWGRALAGVVAGLAWPRAVAQPSSAPRVGVDSDYRYRGVSLSDSQAEPAPDAQLRRGRAAGTPAPRRRASNLTAQRQLHAAARLCRLVDAGLREHELELGRRRAPTSPAISGYDFAEAYAGLLGERWSARLHFAPDYYGRHVADGLRRAQRPPAARRTQPAASRHFGALHPLHGAVGDADRTRGDVSLGAGSCCAPGTCTWPGSAATRGGPYPAVYGGAPQRARRGRVVRLLIGVDVAEPLPAQPAYTVEPPAREAQRSARSCSMAALRSILAGSAACVAAITIASCGGGGGGGSMAPFARHERLRRDAASSPISTTPGNPVQPLERRSASRQRLGHRLQSAGLRLGRQQRHVDLDALRRQRRAAVAGRRDSRRAPPAAPARPASSSTARRASR